MNLDKILIIGAGAIGAFYGALIAKAGADVSVVCRSDYDVVQSNGYLIESNDLGSWVFRPAQVLKSAADFNGHADYVVLCTKITHETNRVKLIQNAVTKNTCIVFIQNGVEIEQELVTAFPNNEVVSGLAFMCCNKIQQGVIHHIAYGKLTLGSLNHPSMRTDRAQHLCDLISQAGMESIVADNIVTSRWLKCLWNAAFNPLSILSDGLSTQDILSTQEQLIRTIMQEVCLIADACGHCLPEDSIDFNITNTYAMPPYKTSMLLDYERCQPMEIEAILGNTIRAAKREQVACPTLDALYALIKLKTLKIEYKQL